MTSSIAAGLALLMLALHVSPGQETPPPAATATAQGTVDRLYELVSFDAGRTPDWDAVRALFLEQAVIVLRTARDATTTFTLDGFVADFEAFIERASAVETGFHERILRTKATVCGDMAHVLVLYEAELPGRPAQQGVDSFQLIRRDERWWIVSVTNEIPGPDRPIPEELAGE